MGFLQSPSGPMDVESISKARFDENGDVNLGSYNLWLAKYPSALLSFEQMMSTARGKKIVVFLDYDGTLSQIVDNPDQAFMTDMMRSAVSEVAYCFPTAIVSGRRSDKVKQFVQLNNVYYAGSHGMDISTPSGSLKYEGHKHQKRTVDEEGNVVVLFQPAQEFLPTIQEIIKVLDETTKSIEGAMVEDNKFCVSVHFRCVDDEQDVVTLEELVKSAMEAYPNFVITEGKKVMEIRPPIDWDKGRALEYLLDTLELGNSNDVLPIYLGDDKTDEDAFKMIKRMGRGYPIIVSTKPKESNASHSLRDPLEVMRFLMCLAKWKKSFPCAP